MTKELGRSVSIERDEFEKWARAAEYTSHWDVWQAAYSLGQRQGREQMREHLSIAVADIETLLEIGAVLIHPEVCKKIAEANANAERALSTEAQPKGKQR